MGALILDTDILIDISRSDTKAIDFFNRMRFEYELALSVITKMELIVGCRDKTEIRILEKFLTQFEILGFYELIGEKACNLLIEYRLSHGLKTADSIIAATAIVNRFPLVTKNQRDYKFIMELDLYKY